MRILILLIGLQFFIAGCGKQGVMFNSASNSSTGEVEGNTIETDTDEQSVPDSEEVKKPAVRVVQSPKDQIQGADGRITFEVFKGDNDIQKVKCYINGVEVECDTGGGNIDISNFAPGDYTLKIVVTDTQGIMTQAKEKWSVRERFKKHTSNLRVGDKARDQIDILFVIDSSSSMWPEREKIQERFKNFMSHLVLMDWHLGIITTDSRQARDTSDGKLIPFSNGDYFLTSAVGMKEAQRLFIENIRREESGSDMEKGIYTTYRAIERATDRRMGLHREMSKFFRQDSVLAVIIVSDEDESGDMPNLNCEECHFTEYSKSNPEALLGKIRASFGEDKIFQFHSIITRTRECLRGQGKAYGYHYRKLSRKTGGVEGDICAEDYASILSSIGDQVSKFYKTYKLPCTPQDRDKDGVVDFNLVLNRGGVEIPEYTIEGRHLKFVKPLERGDYKVSYYCLGNQ